MYDQFLAEIFKEELAILPQALVPYKHMIARMLQGESIELKQKEKLEMAFFDDEMNTGEDIPEEEQDRVGVISMNGMLTKFGGFWRYGTEEYANMLDMAYADESIKAIILRTHSPGGSTSSVLPIEAALKRRNKPVIGAIDSDSYSAGYYNLLFTDKILAIDPMAELGSIGVMATLMDDRKFLKDFGINIIEIVPPESKWKNRAVNEALDGNDQLYIQEKLSPWAIHFQNQVKKYRKKLDLDVEGIIEGRTFYAMDGKDNGLIDDIMPFNDMVPYALELAERQSKLNQLIR